MDAINMKTLRFTAFALSMLLASGEKMLRGDLRTLKLSTNDQAHNITKSLQICRKKTETECSMWNSVFHQDAFECSSVTFAMAYDACKSIERKEYCGCEDDDELVEWVDKFLDERRTKNYVRFGNRPYPAPRPGVNHGFMEFPLCFKDDDPKGLLCRECDWWDLKHVAEACNTDTAKDDYCGCSENAVLEYYDRLDLLGAPVQRTVPLGQLRAKAAKPLTPPEGAFGGEGSKEDTGDQQVTKDKHGNVGVHGSDKPKAKEGPPDCNGDDCDKDSFDWSLWADDDDGGAVIGVSSRQTDEAEQTSRNHDAGKQSQEKTKPPRRTHDSSEGKDSEVDIVNVAEREQTILRLRDTSEGEGPEDEAVNEGAEEEQARDAEGSIEEGNKTRAAMETGDQTRRAEETKPAFSVAGGANEGEVAPHQTLDNLDPQASAANTHKDKLRADSAKPPSAEAGAVGGEGSRKDIGGLQMVLDEDGNAVVTINNSPDGHPGEPAFNVAGGATKGEVAPHKTIDDAETLGADSEMSGSNTLMDELRANAVHVAAEEGIGGEGSRKDIGGQQVTLDENGNAIVTSNEVPEGRVGDPAFNVAGGAAKGEVAPHQTLNATESLGADSEMSGSNTHMEELRANSTTASEEGIGGEGSRKDIGGQQLTLDENGNAQVSSNEVPDASVEEPAFSVAEGASKGEVAPHQTIDDTSSLGTDSEMSGSNTHMEELRVNTTNPASTVAEEGIGGEGSRKDIGGQQMALNATGGAEVTSIKASAAGTKNTVSDTVGVAEAAGDGESAGDTSPQAPTYGSGETKEPQKHTQGATLSRKDVEPKQTHSQGATLSRKDVEPKSAVDSAANNKVAAGESHSKGATLSRKDVAPKAATPEERQHVEEEELRNAVLEAMEKESEEADKYDDGTS